MQMEFKWISEHHPALASSFAAWEDVQELVTAQCGGVRLGLTDAVSGLGIIDNWRNSHQRSAANDAVRHLAVLAGLLAGVKLMATPRCKSGVEGSELVPRVKAFRDWGQFRFSVRLVAADGGKLAGLCARDLVEMFAGYGLMVVGLNCMDGIDIWWLAFDTLGSLKRFICDNESLKVEGKAVKVMVVTGME